MINSNYFKTLGVTPEQDLVDIKRSFKRLASKYHPDKNLGSKKFEDKLKTITLAYSQLKKTLGKK